MKYFVLFSVFLFLSILSLFAYELLDVIYLNDGTSVRGTIIEQQPNVSVKIQTPEGNVQVYNVEEIAKILKEGPLPSERKIKKSDPNKPQNSFRIFYLGVMTGGSTSVGSQPLLGGVRSGIEKDNPSFGMIFGSKLTSHSKSGWGIEYDVYNDRKILPVFFDYRTQLGGKDDYIKPFIYADLGYSLCWINDMPGMNGDGLVFTPGIAIEGQPVLLQIGYRYQWSRVFFDDSSMQSRYNYVILNFGMKF